MLLHQAVPPTATAVRSTLTVLPLATLAMARSSAELTLDPAICEACPAGSHLSGCGYAQAVGLLPRSAVLADSSYNDDGSEVQRWRW